MYGYTDIRERLAFSIPSFWQEILEAREFQDRSAEEFAKLWNDFFVFLDGRYPQTATTELRKWEILLGLPVGVAGVVTWGDNEKRLVQDMEGQSWDSLEFDYTVRRSAVLSRLRGFGTITRSKVMEIANTYTGGAVKVTEYPGEYRVVIEFTDIQGVPEGIETLQETLREAMPAHIAIEFKYKYLKWNELDAKNWTFDQLDAQNLTFDEFDALS